MSFLEIPVEQIRREVVSRQLDPSGEDLEGLLEDLVDDYEVADPDTFSIQVHLWADGDEITVSGKVEGTFQYTCGRCLQARRVEIEAPVNGVLIPHNRWSEAYEGQEEIALEVEDLDIDYYSGDSIDVGPLIREAVILELPHYSPCARNTPERCERAFQEYVGADEAERMANPDVDLRWEPLKNIDLDSDE